MPTAPTLLQWMNSFSKKKISLTIIFLFLCISIFAQKVNVNAVSRPLNEILIEIRDQYHLQMSFNDKLLSTYPISLQAEFDNPELAITKMISGLPLNLELQGGVYLIIPKKKNRKIVKYNVSGFVSDNETGEALPYSHVLVNGHGYVSDFKGNFSYTSSSDSIFKLRVSYLGYYIKDTILGPGARHEIPLKASSIDIKEVVVSGPRIARSVQAGASPGEIRINHKVAGYLPGNGDNSVFNLLRLQPGILAAGEQTSNLIIWGSYEGQSKVVFDGFTIFGIKNFNENISAVNPFLAKDIKVMKGGYAAEYGERVGGIVDISGIDGSTDAPHVNLSINNMTLNGMATVPVLDNTALVIAFRQTYYDLYESFSQNLFSRNTGGNNSNVDLNYYPDYLFRDLNFKYSGRKDNGDNFFLSLYSGSDNFSYSANSESGNFDISNDAEETNYQKGLGGFYSKKWKGGSVSNLTLAYSGLNNSYSDYRSVIRERPGMRPDTVLLEKDIKAYTDISEMDAHIDNYLSLEGNHRLKFGAGIIYDNLKYREDTFDIELLSIEPDLTLINAYVSDRLSILPGFYIEGGLRADYSPDLEKVYLQPRLAMNIRFGERIYLNTSWGKYNQFITLSSVVDESANFRYLWTVCDNDQIPVLGSQHFVGGISYSFNDLLIRLEAYSKKTDGLTRFVRINNVSTLLYGDSRSKGMDVFIRKHFGGHTAWVSYSLSLTEEHFNPFNVNDYRLAMHDQRHEIKAAAIINFQPLYISGNYVYGSGFADPTPNIEDDYEQVPYNRLDLSVVYKFERKKYYFDLGLSVLNVFNTENIKYDNFVRIPADQTTSVNMHAEAVPRTLTIFLNLSF